VYIKILEISSLNTYEYISIIGHYNRLTLDTQVDPRLLTRGYSEEALKEMKSRVAKLPSEVISLNLHFKQGIEKYEHPYFGYIITLFDAYDKNGVLPFPGSYADQPAKIIEIFATLDQLKNERQARLNQEAERDSKKIKRKK
jgi:hypothetical protein